MTGTIPYADLLLDWYDRHRRRLPWRALPGETADPYHVWLSEIMLQQTTVQAVAPYYETFLQRWPTIGDLARADLDEILHAWAGLGYYARARNLHKCAQLVTARHGGCFPQDEEALRRLPGIGDYTAAAIAAIAFDRPAAVMDGNIERVLSRLFAVSTPLPAAKPELRQLAARLTPATRPGDYAQGMMDLGAGLCSPRKPACGLCPFVAVCTARRDDDPERFPAKAAKPDKPTRRAVAFWVIRNDGAVLLRKRPPKGLLGGMIEVPSSDWLTETESGPDPLSQAPLPAQWRVLDGVVRHSFTHFHLDLTIQAAKVRLGDPRLGLWTPLDRIGELAVPTLFRKVIRHALRHG